MKIGVFLQPAADPSRVVLDRRTRMLSTANVPLILNPSDRSAIETALSSNSETYALCIGQKTAETALREALAFGINHACLIESESLDRDISHAGLLTRATSDVGIDVIIFGETTIDYGYTGMAEAVASRLGASFISGVSSLDLGNGKAIATKAHHGKSFKLEASIPCVLTAKFQQATKKYPTPTDIHDAYRKEIKRMNFDVKESGPSMTVKAITLADVKRVGPTIIKGDARQIVADAIRLMKRMF